MFTNGYHLDYGVTSLFVYNVTDMLSDKEKLCARITNLSSFEVEVILGTLIVCMYSIEYLAVSKYCLSHYLHLTWYYFRSYVDCYVIQLLGYLFLSSLWVAFYCDQYCVVLYATQIQCNTVQSIWLELWFFFWEILD